MLSPAPKPVEPLEVEVRVHLGIDGQWYAEAWAGDMSAKSPPMESADRAAEWATRTVYSVAVALGRIDWFWP